MADVIVIGKASHNHGDKPQIVYIGQCGVEAQDAVNKSDLVRFYQIDAYAIKKPMVKSVAAPTAPATQSDESKSESPKSKKSK